MIEGIVLLPPGDQPPFSCPPESKRRNMTSGIKISTVTYLLSVLVLGAFIGSTLTGAYALRELRVGGPVYDRIVMVKDLVADILPPPLYVIEGYLEATIAAQEPANIKVHQARITQLKKDYADRRAYWTRQPLDAQIKRLLTQDSDAEAAKFWTAVDFCRFARSARENPCHFQVCAGPDALPCC
jgi:hypothetical protein